MEMQDEASLRRRLRKTPVNPAPYDEELFEEAEPGDILIERQAKSGKRKKV